MNTTFLLTKDYEQITMNNELIKTNPIKPNLVRHSVWWVYPPFTRRSLLACGEVGRRFQKAHLLGQAGQAVK
jgi:hypothetical protein